ncbi:MAG: calcium-binding protein [Microvirga sp.]
MSIPAVLWGEFLINSEAKENVQKGVQLQALDNGKFMAVWENEVVSELGVRSVEIYAQRFYSGAVPEGEPVRIDTTSGGINSAPTVTMLADGKLVYTWEHQIINEYGVTQYSIRARIFNANGTPFDTNGAADGGTDDFEVVPSIETQVSSPMVKALSGGGFVITYNDASSDDTDNPGVWAQVYSASGQSIDGGAVNVTTTGSQAAYTLVSLSGNRFLSIYSEDDASDGTISLKANICTASDVVLSTGTVEYTISASLKEGTTPAATLLSDGRILITWTEVSADSTGDNVKAQIFDSTTMAAIGAAFIVNQGMAGDQGMPGVTALKGGGFAITYLDTDGTSAHQVRVAVFNATYVRLGDDKVISTAFDEGKRAAPKVIELSDGRLIAAWDENIDGRTDDNIGIRGQVIDARFQGINMPGTAANDQYVGTEFNDTLSGGSSGNDDLNGREGNDILDGGIGDDRLNGGSGADQMSGGTGNDTYYVDNLADVVSEAGGSGTDVVYASVSYTLSADIENLIAEGTNALNLTGNASNNSITGNAAANVIDGGAGADRMDGGLGNDTYSVDNAGDVVVDSGGDADTIQTSISYTLADGIENMMALGAGAINLTGNASNNMLTGNAAANRIDGGLGIDVLNGGAGNDIINGGDGNDALSGGAGKDIFVFNTLPNKATNRDQIADFDVKADKINLDKAVFKKLKKGKLKSDFFKIGTKAGDKDDYLIYNKGKGILSYDADGSGTKFKAVEFATVKKNLLLKIDHFFVI